MIRKIYIDTAGIWSSIIFLTTFGLIMIYSASGIEYMNSEIHGNDSMYLRTR